MNLKLEKVHHCYSGGKHWRFKKRFVEGVWQIEDITIKMVHNVFKFRRKKWIGNSGNYVVMCVFSFIYVCGKSMRFSYNSFFPTLWLGE